MNNNNNIDYQKVKAAVARYVPKAVSKPHEKKPASDSAIRKRITGPTQKCTGFTHPHFLNNEPQ
jgi:hypothetical protein